MISLENFKDINTENWSKNSRFWIEHVEEEENRSKLLYDIFSDKIWQMATTLDSRFHRKGKEPLIVDAGCGEGSFIRKCIGKDVGVKFIGIDICEPFIKWAQEKDKNNTYLIGDLEKEIPVVNEAADIVISLLSLIEIVDLNKAISEMVRVMSKDGHILICILHPLFDIVRLQTSAQEKARYIENYFSTGAIVIQKNIKIKNKTFNRHYFRIHHNLNKYFDIFYQHKLIVKEYSEFHLPTESEAKIENLKPVFIFLHLMREGNSSENHNNGQQR